MDAEASKAAADIAAAVAQNAAVAPAPAPGTAPGKTTTHAPPGRDVPAGAGEGVTLQMSESTTAELDALTPQKRDPVTGHFLPRPGAKPRRKRPRASLTPPDYEPARSVVVDPASPGAHGVNDPAVGDVNAPPGQSAVAGNPGVELGEDTAAVFVEAAGNTAGALVGDHAKPTADESASLKRAATAAMGGTRIDPWWAVGIFALLWIGRVVVQSRAKRQAQGERKHEPSTDRRDDPVRQEPAGQEFLQGFLPRGG